MDKKRTLIVEDESVIAEDIGLIIKDCGYDIAGFTSSGDKTVKLEPDLVINIKEIK